MWKSYMVYKCEKCGFERKTDRRITRFDDDNYHMESYNNSPEMHESQSRAQNGPCPDCGNKFLSFARWSEY